MLIKAHFQRKQELHSHLVLSNHEIRQIQKRVQSWPNIIRGPDELEIPKTVEPRIGGIAFHTDGWKCSYVDQEQVLVLYVCRRRLELELLWRQPSIPLIVPSRYILIKGSPILEHLKFT